MKITVISAVAALLTVTAPAFGAGSAACTVLSDPAADVTVAGGGAVPDTHVDLRALSVRTGARGLTFRITDTALVQGRLGEWRLTFEADGAQLFVGAGRGMWVNAGEYRGVSGFVAGVQGRKPVRVTGTYDYVAGTINVEVPYAAFGATAPRRGDTVRAITVNARETFVNGGAAPVTFTDHASTPVFRLTC